MNDFHLGAMRCAAALLAGAALAISTPAQRPVPDVGLTLDFGPMLPAFTGHDCGTFTCQAYHAGGFGPGTARTFTAFGAPVTPYAIAFGLPGRCQPLPPIGNSLLLGMPVATLHVGTIGRLVPGLRCQQGMDRFLFTMPRTAPSRVTLRFQSIGFGNGMVLAFGPAIDIDIP